MINIMTQFIFAFLGSFGFAIIFNIKGKNMFFSALGGGLGWLIFTAIAPVISNDIIRYFIASLVISVYSQKMARLRRAPTLIFLVISFIPLVPGYSAYKTMEAILMSDIAIAAEFGVYTFKVVMAIATGFLISSYNVKISTAK